MEILLVEDHADSARVLSKILERNSHAVATASNCEEGLRAFELVRFDLVLLDIVLPDGDGCDLLRSLLQVRPVKSIAVTALPIYDNFSRFRDAGFDRYLSKPVNPDRVHLLIGELFPDAKEFPC